MQSVHEMGHISNHQCKYHHKDQSDDQSGLMVTYIAISDNNMTSQSTNHHIIISSYHQSC